VGTVAKAVGDAMITVIGLHATELVDGLYFPLLLITAGTSELEACVRLECIGTNDELVDL
jgi:hypothetical protein